MKIKDQPLEIPKDMVPKEFGKERYGGVFLLFLNGKTKQQIEKKIKQVEKMAEIIKLT